MDSVTIVVSLNLQYSVLEILHRVVSMSACILQYLGPRFSMEYPQVHIQGEENEAKQYVVHANTK